jgi:hypothetical protein
MTPPLLPTDLSEESQLQDVATPERSAARTLIPRAASAAMRRAAFCRRAVFQSPLVKPWDDARYETRLTKHANHAPAVSAAQGEVLAELRDSGVAVRTIALPADVLACADGLVDLLRRKPTSEPCVKATPRELADDPTLFIYGLSPHLLDLAERHIGLPVRYLGVEAKRELVDPAINGRHQVVRRWHLDHEDRRILKVIVYLGDVHHGAGPFGYVHQSHTDVVRALGGRVHAAVSDEIMQTVVPRDEWQEVTGPRSTAIYVDTGQVFHRVFPPSTAERYSISFAYSSSTPYYTYSRLMLPRRALRHLRTLLTQRQWDALPG